MSASPSAQHPTTRTDEQAAPSRRRRAFPSRIVAIAVAWMAACWLVIGALLAPVLAGGWATLAAVAVLGALPIVALARGFGGDAYPSAFTRLWVLRPFWYLQLALPLLAAAGIVGAAVGLPFGVPGAAGRWALALVGGVGATAVLAGYVGSRALVVRHLDVHADRLPASLDGLRIVQLSDLHVGPHTPRRHLERIVQATRDARPDLIVFTGDQVDDYARDVAHFHAAFGDLRAPLGVYAIAGNHDVYAGWSAVRAGLESMGITVLVNEAVPLVRGGARFWIAGTGDPAGLHWSRGGGRAAAPDVPRTLVGVPRDDFAIVLAHNPALWPALAERGADLTLSGHTHHGQLSIPRLGWSLASPFLEHAMGAHARGHAQLYINPGTNYWGIPFRIGALPEVTVLTLRRADDTRRGIVEARAA